ncbi:acyl-CoA dehydrogenase family protein [Streptomyces mirabilis]
MHAYGTRAQRERWLPRVADGSAVAAFALSEPGAGSDAAALALRADRDAARAPTSAAAPGEATPAAREASSATSGAAPGAPGAVPETSGAAPAAPGTWPADPGFSSAASGVAPGVPGAVPAAPGTWPADPGSSSAASGVAPGVPGAVPAGPGSSPAGPGASVVEAQESPVAERDGWGSWRLTGEKCWISNAPEADFYTVFARTTPGAGARGVTAFLVPADRPGLTGTPLDMLSPHPIGALAFDAVPVTADDVLGEPDRGFRVAMHTLNLFRPSVGAFAVGMAEAALAATLTHTAGREAFGGRLKDLQTVAHQVAEMALRTEAARLMVYAAAAAYDEGAPDVPRRAAMAKLLATETAQYVVDAAVQLHGARALRRGHLLEHLYREVRAPRIYEGASEVQRAVIAKELYASVEAP